MNGNFSIVFDTKNGKRIATLFYNPDFYESFKKQLKEQKSSKRLHNLFADLPNKIAKIAGITNRQLANEIRLQNGTLVNLKELRYLNFH